MQDINRILYDYAASEPVRFHMPGHKGISEVFPGYNIGCDITELPFSDNLYDPIPGGPVEQLEEKLAAVFFRDSHTNINTKISCGGATLCIQTALLLMKKAAGRGKSRILADRMLHVSAMNAFALTGIEPVWIYPEGFNEQTEDFAREYNKTLIGVFVTSPDYYGRMRDIARIAEISHKFNLPFCTDNSHGSHLAFHTSDTIPSHPALLGSDITVDSIHKTLPAVTGTALLHIKKSFCPERRNIYSAMRAFATTSPPYPMISAVASSTRYLAENGIEAHKKLYSDIQLLKDRLKTTGIGFYDGGDPYRIVLDTSGIKTSGEELSAYLYGHKIIPEFSDKNNVILIPSVMNKSEDFNRLYYALREFGKKVETDTNETNEKHPEIKNSRAIYSLRDAMFMPSELLDTAESELSGRICAEAVYSYPPGIPIILPGELISDENAGFIRANKKTVSVMTE